GHAYFPHACTSRMSDRSSRRHRLPHCCRRAPVARRRRCARDDLCRRGDRPSTHIHGGAGRAALAQSLLRFGHSGRAASRRCHAGSMDYSGHAGCHRPGRVSRGPGPSWDETTAPPRLFAIQPGTPFLPTLVEALLSGWLVSEFRFDGDPLALADATIFVPTRRAARALRAEFAAAIGRTSAILPTIRPLGEFDEDEAAFDVESAQDAAALDLAPPIGATDRLLLLAPLVRAWKRRLPAHVAALFEEEIVVPASTADAIWLARDLANLIDEIETEGSDWAKLAGLLDGNLAGWWQVTLDFLKIVTEAWPAILQERGRSDPAAHRNAAIRLEAARLQRTPPAGPVIAAGSTGSIPATADLLAVIAPLPAGAVVLPGL